MKINNRMLRYGKGSEMSIGIFISGRLGSERLPSKLILPIGKTCLWEMACEKLNLLPEKYSKYVLAEEGALSEMAGRYSNLQVIIRDKKTALVDGPLSYIFKDLKQVQDQYLMFLNPCQSFLTVETITRSLEKFQDARAEYATSVKPFRNWLFDESGRPINPIDYKTLSTKEIKPIFQAAHCFHIFNKNSFFTDGCMLKEDHMLLPVPEEEALDVDTAGDFEYVRWKHETGD